jgi:hypothetical protein
MGSIDLINNFTDEVILRLNANKATMGNFTRISERDEDPQYLSNSKDMPILIVIPLADRPDRIKMTMGGTEMYHDFSISIVGYYLFQNLDTAIRTLRGYGYNCVDLFRGGNSKVAGCHVYSATLDVGYFIIVDNPVYRFILTMQVKAIEP